MTSISKFPHAIAPSMTRRRFVRGVALAGVAGACGWRRDVFASDDMGDGAVLSGTEFDLSVGEMRVNFTGSDRMATVINGRLPAPLLRWREGDTVSIRVRNTGTVSSSIHWHGMIVPADMDGVPGLSFSGIAPGATYTYRFKVNQAGTYWYHSHSRFQEQLGLYGPIVIEPRNGAPPTNVREHVIVLSDWTDIDPEHIYATLKKRSDYYNFGKPVAGDFLSAAHAQGVKAALAERRMWNQMRMDPSDIADVSAHAYTYLMNGTAPAANWTGLFAAGEKVRLRFINASSMTFFDVRIPGLKMTVIAADGQAVEPVSIDEFRIATAETFDVVVEPAGDCAYTIFAQSMDRSGFARGTLAPRVGMETQVPPLESRVLLTMGDMMGDMPSMQGMQGMSGMQGAAGLDGHGEIKKLHRDDSTRRDRGVDMRVAAPRPNLDDPGIGLRDNGRRVLTYADLHSVAAPISVDTQRDIVLHLTGHMQRYIWSFDGARFSDAEPLRLRYGERVRITLVNDTMMAHPIHLHGMWSELETPGGEFQVRKHTLVVQPAQQLSYRVSADALGRWAYHCHLLYHMEAGMFREVVVA